MLKLIYMQPTQSYNPAPPDPSSAPPENPYDFFLQDGENQKKSGKFNLPGGNSTTQRILIIVGGGIVLILIGIIIMSFLSSGNKSNSTQLLEIAQQQTEIIRVANIGLKEKSVRSTDTLELASNTTLSVQSSQNQVVGILTKSGTKVNSKLLGIKQNAKTDATLSSAAQSNNYDSVFVTTLQKELQTYQLSLKNAFNSSPKASDKKILSDAFKGTGILLGDINTINQAGQ